MFTENHPKNDYFTQTFSNDQKNKKLRFFTFYANFSSISSIPGKNFTCLVWVVLIILVDTQYCRLYHYRHRLRIIPMYRYSSSVLWQLAVVCYDSWQLSAIVMTVGVVRSWQLEVACYDCDGWNCLENIRTTKYSCSLNAFLLHDLWIMLQ